MSSTHHRPTLGIPIKRKLRKRETIINQPPRQPNHSPSSNHRKDLRNIAIAIATYVCPTFLKGESLASSTLASAPGHFLFASTVCDFHTGNKNVIQTSK